MMPRTFLLSTVPNGGLDLAVKYLMEELANELDHLVRDDPRDEAQLKLFADLLLGKMVERYVETKTLQGERWTAGACVDLILKVAEANQEIATTIIPEFGAGECNEEMRARRWKEYFERTFRFLRARHSSEAGQTVAFRVLGDVGLPPEVVEMVGDVWWEPGGWERRQWLIIRGSRRGQ